MSTVSERLLSALGGSYTIERELTGGGMALVFAGEDHDLGRKVVIKILPPELAATVSAERFRREILTVARLQHPHIVPILKAADIDGRADIYSLGVTAYEMLAGGAPLANLNPREMLTARLTLPPPPLSTIRKDVPIAFEKLIAKCLAIDPADRPQSATALVEALEDPEAISGSFATTAARHGKRVKRAVIGALALIGAIVVSAGIYAKLHTGNASAMAESTASHKPVSLGVIAVLPFVSLGSDSSNAYLATGVTNAVAGKLMKTPGLRVLAPGLPRSVRRRSDTAVTASLRARLVLEGTVERAGNRLRVTARLSSTDDDVMRWADVYDRDVKDIFAVEDDIAGAIVASVTPMTGQKRDRT